MINALQRSVQEPVSKASENLPIYRAIPLWRFPAGLTPAECSVSI